MDRDEEKGEGRGRGEVREEGEGGGRGDSYRYINSTNSLGLVPLLLAMTTPSNSQVTLYLHPLIAHVTITSLLPPLPTLTVCSRGASMIIGATAVSERDTD